MIFDKYRMYSVLGEGFIVLLILFIDFLFIFMASVRYIFIHVSV